MAEASAPAGSLLFVFGLVALWYAVNIGVVIFNKYVLSSEHFENAAFLTLCHMSACVLVGYFIQGVVGWFPLKPLVSKQQFYKVAVLSVIFLGSIVLANASLEYIPVSFNQAIGATTPLFTALFAVVILQKQETWLTYSTLIPIVIGIVIASGGEPVFHVLGFSLALIATSSRALKTVVQSMLMTDPKEKLDPMSLLLYMSACAWVLLIPVTLITEPGVFQVAWARCSANPRFMWSLVANSLMAYVLNLVNFLVTKYTSALTQQVLGQGKGLLGAIISVMIFKNKVRAQGWIGYCLAVAGVLCYTFSKRFKPKTDPPALEQALAHKVSLNGGYAGGLNGMGSQRDDEESPLLSKEQAVSTAVAGGHSGRTTPRHTNSGNRALGDL